MINTQLKTKHLLQVIQHEQRPNGSFPSWSAPINEWRLGTQTNTTYFCSTILGALPKNITGKTISLACSFLWSQKTNNCSWNYWTINCLESKIFQIPNDLDDTHCAAFALYKHNNQIFSAQHFAKILKLLLAFQNSSGGPYYTWIVPSDFSKEWRDIDIAVNCNIAKFLYIFNTKPLGLYKYIESQTNRSNFKSQYYCGDLPTIYFLSRFYDGPNKNKVIQHLLQKRKKGIWNNPQDTALATTALLNLGVPTSKLKAAVKYLKSLKPADIKPYPFCYDPVQNGQQYAAGSTALTAALVLETLDKYDKALLAAKATTGPQQQFYQAVVKHIHKDEASLPQPMRKHILHWVNQVLTQDKTHKIVLSSYWAKNKAPLPQVKLASLATFYGWMNYLLQDKLLDNKGSADLLPLANYFARQLHQTVTKLEKHQPGAMKLLSELCQTMDEANLQELKHFRLTLEQLQKLHTIPLPTKTMYWSLLANKSIGFAFGPALFNKKPLQFYHHYLTARQLNDDAHDWEQDLQEGQLNCVSIELLKLWRKANPNKTLTIKNAGKELRPLFWKKHIKTVALQIEQQCDLAEQLSRNFPLLLKPLRSAASQVQQQHLAMEAAEIIQSGKLQTSAKPTPRKNSQNKERR